MRFFDFVEQQHAVRALVNGIRQKPALVKPDISRGGTNQAADAVALHIFRHIKPLQRNAKDGCKLPCDFGLADTCWTAEQIAANGLFGVTQTCTAKLYGARQYANRLVLPENDALKICLKRAKCSLVVARNLLWRDPRDGGNDRLDFARCNQLAPL